MKLFLDTAHYDSLKKAVESGLIDGVTTNPTHLSKEEGDITSLVKKIAALLYPRQVSVEVTEKEPQAVYAQARAIATLAPNVVVKIPCHADYLSVIKTLVHEGTALNITLLFSAVQGLAMSKLHVRYISPFIGRLDDIDSDGIQLIKELKELQSIYEFDTQILAASLRSVQHLHESALAGADCATLPVSIFNEMLNHPLTDAGIARFEHDWKMLNIKKFP